MPAELGGTGYGSEQNLLLSNRTGVPLAIYQNHHHQQQQQQQHQYQLQHYNHHHPHPHLYQHQNSNSSTTCLNNPLSSPQRQYDPEYARMESWMDENQEFVQDYFIR
ncbi:dual 3',5'-cyclic-AMP and -GMP phosphodiesterase 11-like [Lucilia cuprina]|nr:dual 3',5'-cyclic-AMP and -GMP phosphodiesterase 11-like [Lucilia cuprina]